MGSPLAHENEAPFQSRLLSFLLDHSAVQVEW